MAVIAPPSMQAGTMLKRFYGLVNISATPPIPMTVTIIIPETPTEGQLYPVGDYTDYYEEPS